uniref:G-protein coupled receptors family 1 profile domain-containing protein n=1 Tax=Equus caballus TaxID=9796 RepID=A0A3Q2I958_HORSE
MNWREDPSSELSPNSSVGNGSESSHPARGPRSLDGLEGVAGAGAALTLWAPIAGAYLALCAVGLVGNMPVLVWVQSQQQRPTDLQFVLTLPFWAVDVVRDFSWPFGGAVCKVVLTLTVLNMYASSFFFSATSAERCCAVSGAQRCSRPGTPWAVCVYSLLWATAVLAVVPTALFASVGAERLCLLCFPDGSPDWLALYHLQKIAVAFVLPPATLATCSLLLLRFLRRLRGPSGYWPRRLSPVTHALSCVLLAFVLCWLPNQALTFWGVPIKLNAVPRDHAYFLAQAFLFPVFICQAHSNSCLNRLLYCLLLCDFRQGLRELCGRASAPRTSDPGPTAVPQQPRSPTRPEPREAHLSGRTTSKDQMNPGDPAGSSTLILLAQPLQTKITL